MGDLQAGRIDYLCDIVTTAKAQIDGNTVKALALMNATRSPALPDVPTVAEQGFPTAEAYTWNAIFLPKNAPEAIVKKLNEATLQAMHSKLVKERLEGLGAQIVPDNRATPQYLTGFVKTEIVKWAGPIKASGATAD
jgi:tripartite-type tricarboxylate transporter receptor subunit TctC